MKQPKIVKLEVSDLELLSGVDAIAFVESPAIEIDFQYFNKQTFEETYNDYPQKAIENAKRGIELNAENNNKCATQVGKVRAQQLANGENLSLDTIRRMRSFLIRQRDNYELARNRKDYTACGYISYLLWGGEEALPWAEKKLRQAGEEFDINVAGLPNYNNEVSGSLIPNVQAMSKTEKAVYETYLFEKFIETLVEEDSWVDEMTDDIEDAVYNALLGVGIDEQTLIDEGYELKVIDDIDTIETFAASVSEIAGASDTEKPSVDDIGTKRVLYRYTRYDGGRGRSGYGDNSRQFCVNVMKAGKLFRKEDINKLTLMGANAGFGMGGSRFYDIFRHKGGKNCQHFWQAVEVSKPNQKRPTAVLERINEASRLNQESWNKLLGEGMLPTETTTFNRVQFSQEVMDEQRLVATPIMVPNKLIPRVDENGDKYWVYFTDETIKQISYKFQQSKLQDRINHEHDMDSPVNNVYLAESWIVEEPTNDKSNVFGYSLPKGSWFGLFKVDNGEYWNDYIKSGKVRGVSVEGYFINKLTKLI